MYKFPVIKNKTEYGVSVSPHYMFSDTYEIKVYKKIKIFGITIRHKVIEKNYSYDNDSDYYIKLLESKTLYKHLADIVIAEHEEITAKGNLVNQNQQAYLEWDGKL